VRGITAPAAPGDYCGFRQSTERGPKMITALTLTLAAVLSATFWAVRKLALMATPIESDEGFTEY